MDEISVPSNASFLCFHFNPSISLFDHEIGRIVAIRISFKPETKYNVKKIESFLCDFRGLERLQLDNLGLTKGGPARLNLPKLRKILKDRGAPAPEEPPVVLGNCPPELCCVRIKQQIGMCSLYCSIARLEPPRIDINQCYSSRFKITDRTISMEAYR